MLRKIGNYLALGTVLWLVEAEQETIDAYILGKPRQTLRVGDFLEGVEVLQSFRLTVASVFSD